jgi:Mor family transcriptional regulator/DNA-binding CsgD family transcriptional regulator
MNINEREICNEYNKGANVYTIRKKYGLGNSTIKNILKSNNIPIRDGRARILNDIEQQQICDEYLKGVSVKNIMRKYKADENVIKSVITNNNIKIRNHSEASRIAKHEKRIWHTIDLGRAKELYFDEKQSLTETSTILGISPKTLKDFFIGNNIKIREGNEPEQNMVQQKIWSKYPTEKIIEHYKAGEFAKTLADRFGMHIGTVFRLLKRNNVKLHSMDDWMALRKRWHKKYILPSGKMVYVQGYEPQFLDYVFLNNLLKEEEIQFHIKGIQYKESDKKRWYYPDFLIPKYNLIIEVKSTWILQKQTAYTQQCKQKATTAAGFNYMLILDNDFSEFEFFIKQKNK